MKPVEPEKNPHETEEKLNQQLAESNSRFAYLRTGGTSEIRQQILQSILEKDKVPSVSQLLDLVSGTAPPTLKNPHLLTQQQDDLRKNVYLEFGPPHIS
ncbi:MAG: hypothetical protein UV63_C0033G0025 [Microgenomates group bacterium GW2011_GWC1_43_11]|uniref:Uncharacterized protein n=1 Tax=Candidatus Gottesmanbacteria bacterium GW2011_GWB1_44_11c TaxID=1618447 RepID=A0A0G1GU42_9BACT|nr:MAG: hypothetical protein UV63_C0033G0025 [Microgenomates group bacterium GW2011_GWC1_43_11]KKT38130.1 MAG: hypothetical protein UW22_C0013G0017 [Candidatus Gottesmanbacteria bacterium GW2011_GWB1_44_11c]HCM82631.1 hypothetical protein [Patescibacteria group bacterium]